MRKQLYECKIGRRKNFGYSIILVAFFERVLGLCPAVPLPVCSPRQPRMSRWGDIFLYQGGGGSVQRIYDDEFYFWWERQLLALEQFPYVGMDFHGDNNLVLPPGGAWEELGNFYFQNFQNFYEF